MEWRRNASNGYEAYTYAKGKPIYFQVTLDGRYIGYVQNNNSASRSSEPELFVSGKCISYEEAIDYINGLVDKINTPKVEKTTPAEDTYIEKLAETLDNTEVEENTLTDVKEEVSDFPPETPGDSTDDSFEEEVKEDTESESVENESSDGSVEVLINDGMATISCQNADGVIKYTTNGREVNASSKIYREPFSVEGVETIKIRVYDADKNVISQLDYIVSDSAN